MTSMMTESRVPPEWFKVEDDVQCRVGGVVVDGEPVAATAMARHGGASRR